MKKIAFVGLAVAGVILFGVVANRDQSQSTIHNAAQSPSVSSSTKGAAEKVAPLVCDGISVTANCTVDGINYVTYIYHPAVAEKTHTETVTTYKEEITSYCTLCNDGTYSPSCATGRGACSHHGGVAQWNAPRYSRVPQYSTKTVVDKPAQEAYYEKVAR